MEQEMEKCSISEDAGHLNRSRSLKTKQLVRSQAIRESASPPRSPRASPLPPCAAGAGGPAGQGGHNKVHVRVTAERPAGDRSPERDQRQPVQIQITQTSWSRRDGRGGRGAGAGRDLLSNHPRVACVCGACGNCPHCRGRRRRQLGINKQDSGIGVDELGDADDDVRVDGMRKANSLDAEYCRCERRDKPRQLSRTDSEEKGEPSAAELVAFISDTLNKNTKDRAALLKIEKELHALVSDVGRCVVRFPTMSSYGRMLVHRCAALFQLSHHIDQQNKNCVVVSKVGTSGGRLPCTWFRSWCAGPPPPDPPAPPDPPPAQYNAKSILKRAGSTLGRGAGAAAARSKSLEQREIDYERTRRRIFSQESCGEEGWPWPGPVRLLTAELPRNRLLKVQSLESGSNAPPGGNWRARGAPAKAHSFGGYGEPAAPLAPPHARALSRQGDLASSSWRLSPSSSGYKTLSLRSTDSTPEPSPCHQELETDGETPEPMPATVTPEGADAEEIVAGGGAAGGDGGAVVWAVTDTAHVPPGVTVIHPQTGRALRNADGSLYRWDPARPPPQFAPAPPAPPPPLPLGSQCQGDDDAQAQRVAEHDRRRPPLEKQHSFIHHEVESPLPPCAPAAAPSAPSPRLYHGTVYYSTLYDQCATQHYNEEPCEAPADSVEQNIRVSSVGSAPPMNNISMGNISMSNIPMGNVPISTVPMGNMLYGNTYMLPNVAACQQRENGGVSNSLCDERKGLSPAETFRIDASYPYPLEYSSFTSAPPALPPTMPPSPYEIAPSIGMPPLLGGVGLPPGAGGAGTVGLLPWVPCAPPPPCRPLLYPNYNALYYPQTVQGVQSVAGVQMVPGYNVYLPPAPRPRNHGHGLLGRYTGSPATPVVHHTYQQSDRRYEPRNNHDRQTDRPRATPPDRDRQTDRRRHDNDRHHHANYTHNYTHNHKDSFETHKKDDKVVCNGEKYGTAADKCDSNGNASPGGTDGHRGTSAHHDRGRDRNHYYFDRSLEPRALLRPHYLLRQMSANAWCRPGFQPRRGAPDPRPPRRY